MHLLRKTLLCLGVALLSCYAVPLRCLTVVNDAQAFLVYEAEPVLRPRISGCASGRHSRTATAYSPLSYA
jgi:hypothetical protein